MARRDHLPILDGVRFVCALAVLAYHFLTVFPLAASSVTHDFDPALALPAGLARYSWWGWVGVDLFFVVSGYVIATSAVRVSAGQFVRRRALRLLPAAWICATLTAIVMLFGSTVPAAAIVTRWTTSMTLFPLGQPIDEIYWTLGVEVAFYGLVAILLRGATDNRARLTTLGAGLALASLTFWIGQWTGMVSVDPQSTPIRLLLLPHGGFFAVGIALHALAERRGGLITWLTLGGGLVGRGVRDRRAGGDHDRGAGIHGRSGRAARDLCGRGGSDRASAARERRADLVRPRVARGDDLSAVPVEPALRRGDAYRIDPSRAARWLGGRNRHGADRAAGLGDRAVGRAVGPALAEQTAQFARYADRA